MTSTEQPAHRLAHRLHSPGNASQVPDLAVARRLGRRNVDAVLVNVQADVQSARFSPWSVSSQPRNDLTALRSGASV